MADMLIKNGSVVFETEVKPADILVRDGKIAAIFAPGTYMGDGEILDVSGLYVFPGSIDPHMHIDNHVERCEAVRIDSQRQAIGGLTTMVPFVKSFGSYFDDVPEMIHQYEENSLIDFAFSAFLYTKQHVNELEDTAKKLGITSFKFIFDKQDVVHEWYPIKKEDALTLDKGDFYYILKTMRSISKKLLLCVHCEDPDVFRRIEREIREGNYDPYSLATYDKVRPRFVETLTMGDTMYLNHVLDGNVYMVHTASKDSMQMYQSMMQAFPSSYTVETCPQYLSLTVDAPCGILGKVNPPIHHQEDVDALWEGIKNGIISTIGTDNVPAYLCHKQANGPTLWDAALGFSTPGLILPVLITEGYFKRNIPLWRLGQVSSTNTARKFLLTGKGEIKPGFDADFAIVDLDWEREITPDLYGCSDYSIYAGMKFKGWPRYTISRGQIIQKNGAITAEPGRGFYIKRSI